jgi:cell division protein FtsI (penicillin-binding protein 3)
VRPETASHSERTIADVHAWRHWLLVLAFGVAVAVLMGRAVYLNLSHGSFLQQQGEVRTLRSEPIRTHRGTIYDRRGEPLAVSTPVDSLWVDPVDFPLELASAMPDIDRLAALLGEDTVRLRTRIARERDRRFLYLRRHLTPSLAAELRELDIPGMHFQREYKRYYPAGEIAAHVVGLTNIDDSGQEGVELAFDHVLRGESGEKRVLKDNRGRVVRDLEYRVLPRPGTDIELSIDLRLQYVAYRELKRQVALYEALSGSLVMLDVETGEVLALANIPSYNPNSPLTGGLERLRNRAVTDVYEPGSTVKPITVALALENEGYTPDTAVDTSPGYLWIGEKRIEDPINRGVIDLRTVLAKSSQVGISRIALQMDPLELNAIFHRFGFGAITGVGFPGEATGWLPGAALVRPLERATLAFGHGLAATPLQLAQAYLVLGSGGVRRPISMLRRSEPLPGERVLERATARAIVDMLEGVLAPDGTGARARVEGYRVAGKTGTVRKVVNGGYDEERHIAYFAGLAPATRPRIAMVVLVNDPSVGIFSGGEVAAPVFSKVAATALRLLNVLPDAVRPAPPDAV